MCTAVAASLSRPLTAAADSSAPPEFAARIEQCLAAAPTADYAEFGAMKVLGSGEFCTACGTTLRGGRVAVKTLKRETQGTRLAVHGLLRETAILLSVRHSNIIAVVAHGTCAADGEAQVPSATMPFLCLEELASTLAAELPPSSMYALPWKFKAACKKWPVERGLDVGLQLARALQHCHDAWMPGFCLLHRDIKPNNIGFTASG